MDRTQTPEFRRWFGNSKAVDYQGKPMVWYHGTSFNFSEFSKDQIGANFKGQTIAFHFAALPSEAAHYLGQAPGTEMRGNPQIKPVYLKAENPLVIESYNSDLFWSAAHLADSDRMDIIRKVVKSRETDHPYDSVKILVQRKGAPSNVNMIVFSPNQIKSIYNKGTWGMDTNNLSESDLNDNFQRWFGNSKVVDAEGNPLPVYHGSKASFRAFDTNTIGKNGRNEGSGIYFTTDRATAEGYGTGGEVYEVYLSIQKPIPYDTKRMSVPQLKKFFRVFIELESKANQEDWRDGFLSNVTYTYDQTLDQVIMEGVRLLMNENSLLDQIGGMAGAGADTTLINRALQAAFGYDGIVSNGYSNAGPGAGGTGGGTIWVAFFPEQIKNVNNAGNWSIDTNDLNENDDPHAHIWAFNSWFSGSKCVDKNGYPLKLYHGTMEFIGNAFEGNGNEGGYFFTPDPDIANVFADPDEQGQDVEEVSPAVLPCYLSIKHPDVIDAEGAMDEWGHNMDRMRNAIKIAKAGGYDGMLIRNVPDGGKTSDQWVAFHPNQIKSIHNKGTWGMTTDSLSEEILRDSFTPIRSSSPTLQQGEQVLRVGDTTVWIDLGVWPKSKTVELEWIKSRPQGTGAGTTVLKSIIQQCMERGHLLTLSPDTELPPDELARLENFYTRLGFQKSDTGDFRIYPKNWQWDWMEESLTWSGHKLSYRTHYLDLDISVENRKGSMRRGISPEGHKWATKMTFPYGYIRGTRGVDKDHVDCFLGPNRKSTRVFVVHQVTPATGEFDEDKCMLGWNDEESAKSAYLSNYNSDRYFGSIEMLTFDEFKNLIFKHKGRKITLQESHLQELFDSNLSDVKIELKTGNSDYREIIFQVDKYRFKLQFSREYNVASTYRGLFEIKFRLLVGGPGNNVSGSMGVINFKDQKISFKVFSFVLQQTEQVLKELRGVSGFYFAADLAQPSRVTFYKTIAKVIQKRILKNPVPPKEMEKKEKSGDKYLYFFCRRGQNKSLPESALQEGMITVPDEWVKQVWDHSLDPYVEINFFLQAVSVMAKGFADVSKMKGHFSTPGTSEEITNSLTGFLEVGKRWTTWFALNRAKHLLTPAKLKKFQTVLLPSLEALNDGATENAGASWSFILNFLTSLFGVRVDGFMSDGNYTFSSSGFKLSKKVLPAKYQKAEYADTILLKVTVVNQNAHVAGEYDSTRSAINLFPYSFFEVSTALHGLSDELWKPFGKIQDWNPENIKMGVSLFRDFYIKMVNTTFARMHATIEHELAHLMQDKIFKTLQAGLQTYKGGYKDEDKDAYYAHEVERDPQIISAVRTFMRQQEIPYLLKRDNPLPLFNGLVQGYTDRLSFFQALQKKDPELYKKYVAIFYKEAWKEVKKFLASHKTGMKERELGVYDLTNMLGVYTDEVLDKMETMYEATLKQIPDDPLPMAKRQAITSAVQENVLRKKRSPQMFNANEELSPKIVKATENILRRVKSFPLDSEFYLLNDRMVGYIRAYFSTLFFDQIHEMTIGRVIDKIRESNGEYSLWYQIYDGCMETHKQILNGTATITVTYEHVMKGQVAKPSQEYVIGQGGMPLAAYLKSFTSDFNQDLVPKLMLNAKAGVAETIGYQYIMTDFGLTNKSRKAIIPHPNGPDDFPDFLIDTELLDKEARERISRYLQVNPSRFIFVDTKAPIAPGGMGQGNERLQFYRVKRINDGARALGIVTPGKDLLGFDVPVDQPLSSVQLTQLVKLFMGATEEKPSNKSQDALTRWKNKMDYLNSPGLNLVYHDVGRDASSRPPYYLADIRQGETYVLRRTNDFLYKIVHQHTDIAIAILTFYVGAAKAELSLEARNNPQIATFLQSMQTMEGDEDSSLTEDTAPPKNYSQAMRAFMPFERWLFMWRWSPKGLIKVVPPQEETIVESIAPDDFYGHMAAFYTRLTNKEYPNKEHHPTEGELFFGTKDGGISLMERNAKVYEIGSVFGSEDGLQDAFFKALSQVGESSLFLELENNEVVKKLEILGMVSIIREDGRCLIGNKTFFREALKTLPPENNRYNEISLLVKD